MYPLRGQLRTCPGWNDRASWAITRSGYHTGLPRDALPCGYEQGRHRTGMRCCWRRPRPPSAGASPDQSEILSCASTCAPLPPLQSVTVTVAFTGHVRPWGVSGGSESESSARMPARGGAEAQRLRCTEVQRGAAAWCTTGGTACRRRVSAVHRGAPRWERRRSACL